MKFIYTLMFCWLFFSIEFAQDSYQNSGRSALNPSMYPFYHGVASGDPLTDRVILWSRITLDAAISPVNVQWEVATDNLFSNVVSSGTLTTDSAKDYTLKVDAAGLQANAWYYYRFAYDTFKSVTGRTRTLPTGAVNNLRFAVASCQDYQDGFYNAHRHLSQRNDVDAVLFLGDYTYEGGANVNAVGSRLHEPSNKTIVLSDYRIRQSQYHLDPDLQAAHQQYPWIAVWDDHETANNSYTDSAKNHSVNDGLWSDRKRYAIRAYEEWMPVRVPDPADTFRIFRRFTWGDLLDLYMIDTRLYDRDQQAGANVVSVYDTVLNDSTRTMVGPVQFDWLDMNMKSSTAQWQVLGQQVMMTPLTVPAGVFGTDPYIINADQWDGYPFERQKFYDLIKEDSIENVVVLTGDIHTAWANDLPQLGYDAANRNLSLGVEFVTPSITSGNELPPLITAPVITSIADNVRYVDLVQHGYYILDITPQRTQADFIYVSSVSTQNFTANDDNHWCVPSGQTYLQTCSSASTPLNTYPSLAEFPQTATSINTLQHNITTISIQPNPFVNEVVIQFNCFKSENIRLEVVSSSGQIVLQKKLGYAQEGLNYTSFDGSHLARGFYMVRLSGNSSVKSEAVIKIN